LEKPEHHQKDYAVMEMEVVTSRKTMAPATKKKYAVMEMEVFALGYLQKVESGILEKTKPTEYRWHRPVKCEEWDSKGRLLYRISEMAVKFI